MQDKTKPDKVITEEIKIIMKIRIFPTENQSRQSAKGRTQPRGRRRVEKGPAASTYSIWCSFSLRPGVTSNNLTSLCLIKDTLHRVKLRLE